MNSEPGIPNGWLCSAGRRKRSRDAAGGIIRTLRAGGERRTGVGREAMEPGGGDCTGRIRRRKPGRRERMNVLEYGKEHKKTLLFLPCTAEPEWALSDAVTLLAQHYHVMQVVYDGHGETGEDFISVETTVDAVTDWLQRRGIVRLDAAYGCSLGGACLTRLLALGKIPVGRAILDGGITPYQLPYVVRKLHLVLDVLSFKMVANSRRLLEAAFPPERFTPPGRDAAKEYDAIASYLKTFSNRTIRNVFWSGNNYALPKTPADNGTKITYWCGDDEKKDRRDNIRFIRHYFPQVRIHGIPKMAHAELVMIHPEEFCRYAEKFLIGQRERE